MFCGQCGQKIEGGVAFCPRCGAKLAPAPQPPVPAPEPEPKAPAPKTPVSRKNIIIIAAVCLAAVILAGLAVVFMPRNTGYAVPRNSLWFYIDPNSSQSRVCMDGRQVGDVLEGISVGSAVSMDGSVGIVRTDANCLYLVTEDGLTLISDDARTGAISADGTALAYITGDELLWLYTVRDGESVQIASEALFGSNTDGLCISPNGKSLLYSTRRQESDGTEGSTLYLYTRGESTKLGDDLDPVGLSNAGRQVYYRDHSKGSLYITNAKGNMRKLSSNVTSSERILFNSDMTQILFLADHKWYYSVNGGEKARISGFEPADLQPVSPFEDNLATGSGNAMDDRGGWTLRLRELNGKYYTNDSELYYLGKDWTTAKISSYVSSNVQLIRNGEKVCYYYDRAVYARSGERLSDRSFLAGDVNYGSKMMKPWVVAPDGSAIYYIDSEDTLWYKKGRSAPRRVAEDVEGVCLTSDGYALFVADYGSGVGTLYGCKNGKNKKYLMEDCCFCIPYEHVTVIGIQEDAQNLAYYAAEKGLDFTLVIEQLP